MMTEVLTFCAYLIGYAVCSGCNVAYFAVPRRELLRRVASAQQPVAAPKVVRSGQRAQAALTHLANPNWTLAAILLANVFFGVKLSQLSDSLFLGWLGVVMPIVAITIFGEFFAQATFLKYNAWLCSLCSWPVWVLKIATAPVSYPLALTVNRLFGVEALQRLNEGDLLVDLELELEEFGDVAKAPHARELDPRELKILINVARGDDELVIDVGQQLDPRTIVKLDFDASLPVFPGDIEGFVQSKLFLSPHPWFVVVDSKSGRPRWVLDADGFVREFYRRKSAGQLGQFSPLNHIYRARIYYSRQIKVGAVVSDFSLHGLSEEDNVIDVDVVIIWSQQGKWIATGGDILGRFLRGIPRRIHWRTLRDSHHGGRSKVDC